MKEVKEWVKDLNARLKEPVPAWGVLLLVLLAMWF